MTKTKMILRYTGHRDFSGDKMYKNDEGIYFSKDDFNNIIYIGKEPDYDPWGEANTLDRYKDIEFITVGDENLPTEAERFNYMMLSRLQMDCDWNLGNGRIYGQRFWDDTAEGHIEEMKRLYNSFQDGKKPEWLTWDQILEYEKMMVEGV